MIGILASIIAKLPFVSEQPKSFYDIALKPIIEGWYLIIKHIIIPLGIVVIVIYLLYKLLQIKIAKCELKEGIK